MTQSAIIEASAPVNVRVPQARQWFEELEGHPERYHFETHAGFSFVKGDFGEVGARFETREQFYGLELTLRFELTEIGDTFFRFRLLRPSLPLWGRFVIAAGRQEMAVLSLEIGALNRPGACLLRLPPLKWAIQRQIGAEVGHIKSSMETTFS